jgi:cyanate permease
MARAVLGVIGGGVVWMVGFLVLAQVLALLWPDYRGHVHTWTASGVYDFTAVMSGLNILFWILSEMAAGFLAVVLAKRRQVAWVLAALLMAYMCFMHLYFVWDRLPWWYNLLVALPSGPAVLLGSRFADRPICDAATA